MLKCKPLGGLKRSHLECRGLTAQQWCKESEGKNVYTKGVLSSENSSASTSKREVWCIPKRLHSKGKRKKKKEREIYIYIYTPKSLQGTLGSSGPATGVVWALQAQSGKKSSK